MPHRTDCVVDALGLTLAPKMRVASMCFSERSCSCSVLFCRRKREKDANSPNEALGRVYEHSSPHAENEKRKEKKEKKKP